MPFYYPFPISRLSRDELLCVVSAWLGHGPKSADAVSSPGGSFSSSSPISVPMVYSHDEWFVQCVPPLSSSLISFLDEDELDETALLAPLRLILGLIMRIPMRIRSREEMPHFLVFHIYLSLEQHSQIGRLRCLIAFFGEADARTNTATCTENPRGAVESL